MNPWLLHEVRNDDVSAKYKEAERFRLAAMASMKTSRSADDLDRSRELIGAPRAAKRRVARWVALLAVGAAMMTTLLAAAA